MNPEVLAPTDPGRLRAEYQGQVAADTLRAGRALSGLCLVALLAITVQDVLLLGLPDVWPYRLACMVPAALFLLASFTILPRRADLVVPSHAIVLAAILSQGAAVTVWLFVNKPAIPGWESGSTSALLVVMLSASVFAAGARPWIPWLIGATLATVMASLGLLGTMSPSDWPLMSDAIIAGLAVGIVSVFQERMSFREFVARHLALARKAEIERQAEELRRHRDRLGERVTERTQELEAANEAPRNDIARREEAERALQASEARYRALVQQAPVGIAITEGVPPRMVFANEMLGRMLGMTPEELVSAGPEGLRELIHPEDRLAFLVATRARVEGDPGDVPRRIRVVRRDGEVRWFEIDLGPVDLSGRPAWQFLFTDVTDRLRWEEERDRLQRIESLSLMAGGIAHDFNNLLTGIQGNLGLARLQVAPADPVRLRLDQAELASTQAAALVGQLVSLTRGGAPVREVLSLADLVSRTASLAVTGTGTRCEFAFQPGLWAVEVDATQVTQVIQNLVLNAVQAMPNGGVLRIGARNVPEGAGPGSLRAGRFVEVTFADQGHGISGEHLERIFDPYFSTKPRGSGLGLTVVYSVVTKHGGSVTVDSRPGDGATFHVFLPASGRPPGAERPTPLPDLPRGRERLLVMDDEPVVREVCVQILQHLGYEVDAAGWGEEAVEMYAAARKAGCPYAAVLLDLTVPGGMGGVETLAALRALDPDVKAIATSGYSDDPAIADHRGTGFVAGLAKPYSPMALGQVVRRVLNRKGPLSSGSLPKV